MVARHAGFVHAVALRQSGGDRHLAEDVAQAALIVLARRPRAAARAASVRGWLHATTCLAAKNARRGESRRAIHERRAVAHPPAADPSAEAERAELAATVDAALCELRPMDRDALALHYVEGRSLSLTAAALGEESAAPFNSSMAAGGRAVSLSRKVMKTMKLHALMKAGVAVDVRWEGLAGARAETALRPTVLTDPTPATAVRVAVEAAGGRDFSVVAMPGGRAIRVVAGVRPVPSR